jgi:hypothetical protein
MRDANELLEHASEVFPEPAGALERLLERHGRRQRNRRLAVIGTVATIWIAFALLVMSALGARDGALPAQQPSPSAERTSPDTQGPYELTDELPEVFPSDLPLPEGVRPVANRVEHLNDGRGVVIQVWFRTERGWDEKTSDAMQRWFDAALSPAGWEPDGNGAGLGGIWDFHVRSEGRDAIVLGKRVPATQRLLHGSDAFPGGWVLYVRIDA